MYEMINEKPELHKRFEACYRDNLHSIWAGQELYRKGNSREVFYNILEKNMMPIYDSAEDKDMRSGTMVEGEHNTMKLLGLSRKEKET